MEMTEKWSHGVLCGACHHGVLPFCVNYYTFPGMWCTEGKPVRAPQTP